MFNKPRQNGKKKNYDQLSIADILIGLGIQDLFQLTTLKSVFLDISTSSLYTSFVDKYPPEHAANAKIKKKNQFNFAIDEINT